MVGNAGTMGAGPYVVPNVHIDAYGVYTNNPPCGAMRGFGSVQAAFGYEAQMDKLAAALGMDPVEFRCQNAMEQGSSGPTGQVIDSPAPVAEMLRRVSQMPLPPRARRLQAGAGGQPRTCGSLPGGVGNTTHGEGIVRGIGYAVGYKNVGFSEGYDDYSTARVRLEVVGGEPVVTVHTAAAEVGQGLVTIEQQICRTELGVGNVVVVPEGHRRRLGRLHVSVPPDLRHRRRGQGRVRADPRAPAEEGRRASAARPVTACGWPTTRSGPVTSRWGRSPRSSARR